MEIVNGALINEKKSHPGDFIVVINKQTGKKIALASMKYFDSNKHKKLGQVDFRISEVGKDELTKEKYEELKAQKAWLKPQFKDLYYKLKTLYGKK